MLGDQHAPTTLSTRGAVRRAVGRDTVLDDLASRRSMTHPVNRWTDLMHQRKRLATTPNVKCKVICVDELACPQPQQANL